MRFVTEMELKTSYRRATFSSFHLGPDQRLTPEARQFLIDRQIAIGGGPEKVSCEAIRAVDQRLVVVCEKISAFLLLGFSLLLERDIQLAEQVMTWQKQLATIQLAYEKGELIANLEEKSNEAIVVQEMTTFHIQLAQGRELAILNGINSCLRELLVLVAERLTDEGETLGLMQLERELTKISLALTQTISQLMRGERK